MTLQVEVVWWCRQCKKSQYSCLPWDRLCLTCNETYVVLTSLAGTQYVVPRYFTR